MIKGLLFDFYGVIVRTEDFSPRHAWDERLGLPVGSVERAAQYSDLWIQAQLGRITPRAYWDGVAELLYMRKEEIGELRKDFFSGDRLNYKLIGLIRDLRSSGYGTALLTNESLQLEARLRELEIVDLFDHILISARIGVMMPDPTAYRVALHTLNVSPHESIFIDDSLANIRGAQMLGIHTIFFRPESDLRSELEKYLKDQPQ
ncbi:MAG TPA: HAD family phosphatase [Aggregatilineaceae bacterium]|nr:HAD family phosphatase [Aggregatilineaceae bacterium]